VHLQRARSGSSAATVAVGRVARRFQRLGDRNRATDVRRRRGGFLLRAKRTLLRRAPRSLAGSNEVDA